MRKGRKQTLKSRPRPADNARSRARKKTQARPRTEKIGASQPPPSEQRVDMTQASPTSTDSRLCKPTGDLMIFEAAALKESLQAVLQNDGLVCLDLSQVKRVDTAAIQLMWAARRLGRLLVTNLPEDLHTKMKQLGFTEPLSE